MGARKNDAQLDKMLLSDAFPSSCSFRKSFLFVVTSGAESHVKWYVPETSKQSMCAASCPFRFVLRMICIISSFTWRLHARKLAHVGGLLCDAIRQPSEKGDSGSCMRHHPVSDLVSSSSGRGRHDRSSSVYIASRNSRGKSRSCTIMNQSLPLLPQCLKDYEAAGDVEKVMRHYLQ